MLGERALMSMLVGEQHNPFATSERLEKTIKVILRGLDYAG